MLHALDMAGESVVAMAASRPARELTREGVSALLAEEGVSAFHLDQQVSRVLDHATPDAVLGVLPFVQRSGEYEGMLARVASNAVDSGQVGRVTSALDRLSRQGATGNGLANDLVSIVDHPRFDEIVDLAPRVRRAGTYPHEVIDAARQAVDRGVVGRYEATLQRFDRDGVQDGTIARDVLGVIDHPRFDEILDLGIRFQRLGGFGHQVFPLAQRVVEEGHLDRVSRAADSLLDAGIGNHMMVDQLVELAGDPSLPRVVELAHLTNRIVPNGYEVIPTARALLASGNADRIVPIATQLADEGIAYQGLAEALMSTVDHPRLDEILRTTRVVRASGAQAHDLQKATAIVDHPRSSDILATLDAIVDVTGPQQYSSEIARSLVDRGQDLDTILASMRAEAATEARFQPDAIAAADISSLGALLPSIKPSDTGRYGMVLDALHARLGEARAADDVDRQLLDSVRTLVDDNRARIAGTRRDGYGILPDYADLGRIDATLRLRALRSQAAAATPPSGTTLAW